MASGVDGDDEEHIDNTNTTHTPECSKGKYNVKIIK
jgi:hypothetical protein